MVRKNNINSFLYVFFVLFFLSNAGKVLAQVKQGGISIKVTLDHADWKYAMGQKAVFSMAILGDGKPLSNIPFHYEIAQERMIPFTIKDTISSKNKWVVEEGTLSQPGFLRCIVTATINGKKYRALATAAFSPDSIKAYAEMPADFSTFWSNERLAQTKIPLDTRMVLLPERCDSLINVYEVSIQNERPGSRIYGILCVPKKPGKYPAALKVPGAGVRPYRGDTALAQKGIITFEIGIHGVTVTRPNQFYYDLAFGALRDYYFTNMGNRSDYYYHRVYLGCLRAVDLLASLPEVDTSRMAVYGGSQGGCLSIITAALDHRIKYIASFYFAMSDLTGYLHGRAGGWPHMFSPGNFARMGSKENIETAAYYDVANFAKLITIPGIYCWGYNDEVCPPTTSFAAYNNIKAPKEKVITKEAGHGLSLEQSIKVNEWLLKHLELKQK